MSEVDKTEAKRAADAADAAEAASGEDTPLVTFTTLVLSMSTTALVQLGDAPAEFFGGAEPPPQSLPMAKHSIDMLALLEEKTAGNLTGEEERLLSQVLHDLRLRYVAASG
ncbi:MAG: DUF1844 domain-containing protein [Myxococcota bacterium]